MQNNPESDETKYSAQVLLKGIQSSESTLGRASTDSLIYDLEMQELHLSSAYEQYSLAEVQRALSNIFGIETSLLLIERIKKALTPNQDQP